MKSNLLLFTDHYPFGTSEPFLADELPYLSQQFGHILIVPLDSSNNSIQRSIPDNAEVFTPTIKDYKSKSQLFFRGLTGRGSIIRLLKELIHSGAWKDLHKLVHWLTVALLIRTYTPIFQKVAKSIEHPENTVLYFYWGQRWSQVLPFFHHKFREIVLRIHGSDLYEYLYRDYIPFRKQQLLIADKIFTISEMGQNYLKKRYPELETKIQIARLGSSDWGLNPINKEEGSSFTIVSCAGLIKIKRIPQIPEILSHTKSKIHWYHFGDGPEMEDVVKACQLIPSHVSCRLMGHVTHKELLHFYSKNHVDLFINVSITEGIPVSIMEALSFGIPVMATDVGGTSELVYSQNGYLIPKVFSPSETGHQLDALLQSESLPEMRRFARESWRLLSDSKKVYPEFIIKLAAGNHTK